MKRIFVVSLLLLCAFISVSSVQAHAILYDCTSNTCTISSGNLYTAGIDVAGEHDYYYFTPVTSGYYVIETYGTLDTYMSRTIDFGIVLTNDNGGEKRNANMGFYGSANSTYIFDVRAFSSSSTGDYKVQVRYQHASIITFDYGSGDIDTTPDSITPISELQGMGYSTRDYQNIPEITLNNDDYTGLNRLNKEILFWSGHGNKGFVSVVNYNLTKTYLYSTELPYMGNVKLAVWAACYSSSDSTSRTSMAEESINQGARASIGWPDTTTVGSSKTFTNHLFIRLNDGYSVSDSASYAASKIIWPWDNVKDYELFGTTSGTIYTDVNNKQNITSYIPLYTELDPWMYTMSEELNVIDSSVAINLGDNNSVMSKSSILYKENNGLVTREYTYVNGILISNFVDRTSGGEIVEDHRVSLDMSSIDFDLFEDFNHFKYIDLESYEGYNVVVNSSHNAIINYENKTLPIRIIYLDLFDKEFGDVYSIAKVFNIATGEELDYSDISYID